MAVIMIVHRVLVHMSTEAVFFIYKDSTLW